MSGRSRGDAMPRAIEAALREFVNALSKAGMYPPGHQMVVAASDALCNKLNAAFTSRDSISLGITPRGMLLDGASVEPLPTVLRDLAARLHRKNIGTIALQAGLTSAEVGEMLTALSATHAEEIVGVEGLRLAHVRVEPMVYDVLAFADPSLESDLDDVFWGQLVEAAFGRRLADGEAVPSSAVLADAISERATQSQEGARRVFEALGGFSHALVLRGDRASGSARKRFVEVLAALSQPTTIRVVAAAPSSASRRRFLRDTLSLVPPAQLLMLLESVAEADGEPISPYLRALLGKLAGGSPTGGPGEVAAGAFASQVGSLVEQWEGVTDEQDEETDPRLGMEPARIVAIGLELSTAAEPVLSAAANLAGRGQLTEVLQLLEHAKNDGVTVQTIADAVLDPGLLERLLSDPQPDFALIERVAVHARSTAVDPLLDALARAEDRGTRRRLLDLLVRLGPSAEAELVGRLEGAPWYLARNILAVLAQFPSISSLDQVFAAFNNPEPRVRQEALKVLLRQSATRDRAVIEALESGDDGMGRVALASLGTSCPPLLVAPVLTVLGQPDGSLQLQAIRLLATTSNPLIVPQLLTLVRARRGIFRRLRLLPKTPVMLAALEVLATRWRNHRPVLAALHLASKSSDPDIRALVEGGE
ncbi:MAG: hypothetical protein ABJC19_11960 [Gemmatimonadota bacterium]